MTSSPMPAPGRTASPRTAAVWLLAAAAVAVVGWLLVAVSDWTAERVAGAALLAAAALALATGVLVLRGAAPRRLPEAASAVLVLAGLVAGALVATRAGGGFLADVLLVGGVPVVAGVGTWLAGRARRAA